MTLALPARPDVYDQRIDKSGFIGTTGVSAHAFVSYSLKGSLRPVLLTTTSLLDSKAGRPNAKVSFAHYLMRHLINKGFPVYHRRVVNGATYGGAAIISNAAANTVTSDLYPTSGSPYQADPDPDTGIAPNGPGYTALTFSAALVTLNSFSCNLVLDSTVVAVGPVVYSGSSDATMLLIAAAIQAAIDAVGSGGKAKVIDNDPTNLTNARTISIFAPQGQQIAITSAAVTAGASQPTITQQKPLYYVQAENPGAWSKGIGVKPTNADVGTKEVVQMTFATSVGSVSSVTVTINGVACAAVANVTPSDAFLDALAVALAAHPDVDTADVIRRPLGNDNDRAITIRMLHGSSTDAAFEIAKTGAAPTITVAQVIKGVSPSGAFDLEVYSSDNPTLPIERHRVSIATQVDNSGQQQNIAYVVNRGPNYSENIRIIQAAEDDGSVVMPFDPITGDIQTGITWLSAGDNGALPTATQLAESWKDYEDTELYYVNTLVNAGYTSSIVQQAMTDVAKKRNDGTHAILDIPSEYQKYAALINYKVRQMPIDSEYASAYYPDTQMEDPYTGVKLWVPNSGHMAAVYANNDAVRGIGKAPAGLRVGQVDTSALRYEYKDDEHSNLFLNKLNPIRRIGGAFYVMGDTTLQRFDSALSFVSISRLVGYLQGRIRSRAKFWLFEGNNDVNAFSLVTDIEQFLEPWKTGGDLNEYQVVSQIGVNNTNGTIEQGDRIVDVILDPTRTMRRILIRSTITRTGGVKSIEVSEL